MEYNENEEKKEQEIDLEEESSDEEGSMKQWLSDNLRIIISILIVVLIAGGIYSYSKRTESPQLAEETAMESEEEKAPAEIKTDNQSQKESEQPVAAKTEEEKTSSITISQETENSFIETASKGDSKTTLARKALANYLEKNPDSSLKAEHKIYIEDYLRKMVSNPSKIMVGTSVEFSKDMISGAITKAKTLNENQIQNLHKYAVRVPSLS